MVARRHAVTELERFEHYPGHEPDASIAGDARLQVRRRGEVLPRLRPPPSASPASMPLHSSSTLFAPAEQPRVASSAVRYPAEARAISRRFAVVLGGVRVVLAPPAMAFVPLMIRWGRHRRGVRLRSQGRNAAAPKGSSCAGPSDLAITTVFLWNRSSSAW